MAPELGHPIHKDVRDGVPVYWSPEAPRLVGALMFRVGCSDETVTTRGITHLVEHLSLYKLGFEQSHEFNGSVDGVRVLFWASGKPQQVVAFLRHVCYALGGLPIDRLEAESRVLRTEASGRQMNFADRLQWCRFGARGHGLGYLPEFLLQAPDALAIRTWAAERFTAENAVAWFSGPLPDDLRFEGLPHGQRRPSPEPVSVPKLQLPAFLQEPSAGIGVSFLSERENWISTPLWVARIRLMERLRYQDGITYGVQCGITHLTGHHSHSVLWVSSLQEHARAVQQALFEVLDDLAGPGPKAAELQQIRDQWIQSAGQPESVFEELDTRATSELLGAYNPPLQAHLDDFDSRPADRWAASMRAALSSAMILLPQGCEPVRTEWAPYPIWSDTIASGRRYRAMSQRFPWSKKMPELIVGKSAVSLVVPTGRAVTVAYESCAGAVIHPDGMLQLFGEDGFVVAIAAHEWRSGEQARSEALRRLPLERVIEFPKR